MEREIIRLKSSSTYLGKLGSSNLCVQTAGSSREKFFKPRSGYPARAEVIAKRGHIEADDLASVRGAAYSDANIIDVVALVAQISMTNFIHNMAGTPIDFDVVEPSSARG